MICPKCGARYDSKYCPECGASHGNLSSGKEPLSLGVKFLLVLCAAASLSLALAIFIGVGKQNASKKLNADLEQAKTKPTLTSQASISEEHSQLATYEPTTYIERISECTGLSLENADKVYSFLNDCGIYTFTHYYYISEHENESVYWLDGVNKRSKEVGEADIGISISLINNEDLYFATIRRGKILLDNGVFISSFTEAIKETEDLAIDLGTRQYIPWENVPDAESGNDKNANRPK